MDDFYFLYNGIKYPSFIKDGNHAQYIIPIAKKLCVGYGIDIGYAKEEWKFPGATGVDSVASYPFNNALRLPFDDNSIDYVFSSHCLEHIPRYYDALEEWTRVLKKGGILFLYLPSVKCEYWRPANNRKHIHIFEQENLEYDFKKLGYNNIFYSGVDLSYSFSIVGQKCL